MSICDWTYTRLPHIVRVYTFNNGALTPEYHYFGGGDDIPEDMRTELDIPEDAIVASDSSNTGFTWIEYDDSVAQILHKIELRTGTIGKYLYMCVTDDPTASEQEYTMMGFEYFARKGKPPVAKKISVPANIHHYDLSKVHWTSELFESGYSDDGDIYLPDNLEDSNRNSLESNTFSMFNAVPTELSNGQFVHVNIEVIPLDSFINYFRYLREGVAKVTNPTLTKLCKIYFPHALADMSTLLHNPVFDSDKVRYTSDNKEFEQMEKQALQDYHTINMFANPEEFDNTGKLAVRDCKILEVVIHVNYEQRTGVDFLDPIKIFDMFRLTHDIPFARYRGDSKTFPKFRIHKDLTNPDSKIFVEEKELREWVTSIKKIKDSSAPGEKRYSVSGKGLSYKQLLYTTKVTDEKGVTRDVRKYLTLNIYRDGKLEIKCFWDERNPGDMNSVVDAVKKVQRIIREINKLQYHAMGVDLGGRRNVKEPDFMTNPDTNTKITFFNILYDFTYPSEDPTFFSKLSQFAQGFATYVSIINTGSDNSMEMRYKRVNGYMKMNGVYKFISDLERNQDQDVGDSGARAIIKKVISNRFNISLNESETLIKSYEMKFKDRKDFGRKKSSKPTETLDDAIKKAKNPGIDIKITKSTAAKDVYKVFILGVTEDQLRRIYYFVKYLLSYYINAKTLITRSDDYKELESMGILGVVNMEDERSDAISKILYEAELAVPKATKKETAIEEEDQNEFGDFLGEDEGEGEEGDAGDLDDDEEGPKSKAPAPAPAAPKKAVVAKAMVEMSLLDRLKEAAPELFATKADTGTTSYARACQKNDNKQPHVLAGDEGIHRADELRAEIQAEIDELKKKSVLSADEKNLLRELEANRTSITDGAVYRGNFYFCPKSWDYVANNFVKGNDPKAVPAGRGGPKPYFIKKVEGKEAAYKSFLTFIDSKISTSSGELCLPCCLTKRGKAVDRRSQCLGTGATGVKSKTNKEYVLQATKTDIDLDRFALLPTKLNDVFNNGKQCRPADRGQIQENYDCILRKGTAPGENYFLNCIAEIKSKSLTGYAFLEQLRQTIIDDKDYNILRSLKRGSIFNIFAPDSLDEEGADDATGALNHAAKDNFLTFMSQNKRDINETFLWDFVSMPGVVTRGGINLFILEGYYTSGSQKTLKDVVMKCPIGYDTNILYNKERSTVVLYKYGNIYEIICQVTSDAKRSITHNLTFSPDHPLIPKLIKMTAMCTPVDDQVAKSEYNQFVRHITKAKEFDKIFGFDYQPPSSAKAIELIGRMITHYNDPTNNLLTHYEVVTQVLDTYHKVRYLQLDNDFCLPVQPSGLVLKNSSGHDLEYTTTMPEPITLEETIITLLTLENYGKINGVHPFAFLIDPGENIDDPADDKVIGLFLRNGTHVLISDSNLLVSDAVKLEFTVDPPISELEPIVFRCKDLKFDTAADYGEQYAYYNENELDQKIHEQDISADKRQLYSVRTNFEEESYERLRF